MNRLFVVFCVLLVLFSSCNDDNWADSVITNNSEEFEVTFKFNNTEQKTLASKESVVFETTAYQHIENYFPEKRVYFTYKADNKGYKGQFQTRQSWIVNVRNTLDEDVILSADGWMEEMTIQADNMGGNRIYTDNPNFSVSTTSGFPAVVIYYKEDTTLFVTIK
ncbi:MAG: hypothetical protein LBQ93_05845 [Treponema sp.]|jgi:hypothetical protein|nr:hypothetical protein [Treponema sp.]